MLQQQTKMEKKQKAHLPSPKSSPISPGPDVLKLQLKKKWPNVQFVINLIHFKLMSPFPHPHEHACIFNIGSGKGETTPLVHHSLAKLGIVDRIEKVFVHILHLLVVLS